MSTRHVTVGMLLRLLDSMLEEGWITPELFREEAVDNQIWNLVNGLHFWVRLPECDTSFIAQYAIDCEGHKVFSFVDDDGDAQYLEPYELDSVYWPHVRAPEIPQIVKVKDLE